MKITFMNFLYEFPHYASEYRLLYERRDSDLQKIKRVPVSELNSSMVAASDVYGHGSLLLSEGGHFSEEIIKRLPMHGVYFVAVYVNESNHERFENTVFDDKLPKQNIRRTIQSIRQGAFFKEFSSDFAEATDEFQSELVQIVDNGGKVNTEKLLTVVNSLIDKVESPWHMLDMLHCLRDYDDLTFAHSINVSIIASIGAKWCRFSPEEIKIVKIAGVLHDIGKIRIDKDILKKPSKLTKDEYNEIRKHTVKGYRIIENQDIDERIKLAVLQHHEKVDGSGYPLGLMGERICKIAKIITIADVYDAMTSKRCYRDSLCPFEVITVMSREAYTKYDYCMINKFLFNIASAYLNRTVMLSNGKMGEILYINEYDVARPIVLTDSGYVDLYAEKDIRILSVL